jgi:hypothetical protein
MVISGLAITSGSGFTAAGSGFTSATGASSAGAEGNEVKLGLTTMI